MKASLKFLLLKILVLLNLMSFSQNSISGKVTEKSSDKPIPGVNVYIQELSTGTVTDTLGNYFLTHLPSGQFIVHFSFVGFETRHRQVSFDGKPVKVDIWMEAVVLESDEVVISGNFTSTQHDNTIKVSTMGIKQVSKTTNPSLIGSITKVPGVSMISKGPGVVTPVIRGLSLNNILLLSNGVPMQNYQFSEDHPYLINDNGLARVEIIKGPASLIYGSGAIGGVINLIPEPVATKGTITGIYDLRYFSNTVGVLSNLGIKGNQNGVVWGIRGGINSHKDYIQGNNQFAPNTRFNNYNVNADIGIIRKLGVFRLFYKYNKSNFGMAVEPALKIVTEIGRKNEFWYQDLTDNLVTSQNRFFFGSLKLDIDLSYQNNNRQLKGDKHNEHSTLVNMTLQTFAYTVKASHSINEKARYVIGLQGMLMDNKNGEAPDHVLPNASMNDFSVYGLFQYSFSSLKLEAGLRYSYRNIDVPYQETGGSHDHGEKNEGDDEEPAYIQYDGQFDNLSTSIGMTWNINEDNLIRLNLASAFRSPNLAELTQQGRHGIRYEEGNPDLTMQQNLEIDLGYHLHTRHTTLDISLFYNHIYNYIHLAPTADTTGDGDKIYRYLQAEARLYGGEVSFHIHPHPLHWLHLVATFSQVYGEYAAGGYLPRIPASDIYLEIRLEKKEWKGLRDIYLEGGVDFIFAQNKPSEFETTSNGYNLVNLGFGFDVQLKRNRISFNIKASNLLNAQYYDHLSTLQDLGIYNMGRNIMIGMRVPFNLKN